MKWCTAWRFPCSFSPYPPSRRNPEVQIFSSTSPPFCESHFQVASCSAKIVSTRQTHLRNHFHVERHSSKQFRCRRSFLKDFQVASHPAKTVWTTPNILRISLRRGRPSCHAYFETSKQPALNRKSIHEPVFHSGFYLRPLKTVFYPAAIIHTSSEIHSRLIQ